MHQTQGEVQCTEQVRKVHCTKQSEVQCTR